MIRKIFFIAVAIFLYSCQGDYVKTYYDNGSLKYEGLMVHDSIPEGEHKWYYETGEIRAIEYFNNGIQVDTSKEFYLNGVLSKKTFYVNGQVEGNEYTYYDNKNLESVEYFKGGKTKDKAEYFYYDGRKKAIAFYENSIQLYYEVYDSLGGNIIDIYRGYELSFPDTLKIGNEFTGGVKVYGDLPKEINRGILVGFSENIREGVAPSFDEIENSYGEEDISYLSSIITESTPEVYYKLDENIKLEPFMSYYLWGVVDYDTPQGRKSQGFTHTFYVVE